MDRTDSLSRSRCRERRLQCETQTIPAAALHGGTSDHCAGPGETTIKMRVAVPETDLRPCGKFQPNPFSSFAGHASKQTDSETENMSMSMNMSINTGRSLVHQHCLHFVHFMRLQRNLIPKWHLRPYPITHPNLATRLTHDPLSPVLDTC